MERNGMLLFLKGKEVLFQLSLLLLYLQTGWLWTWAIQIQMYCSKSCFMARFQGKQTARYFIASFFGARTLYFPLLGKQLALSQCCCLTL